MTRTRDSYIGAVIPASLEHELRRHPSLLVAFSGGVDSAVVAVAARRVLGKDHVLAAIGVSPSLPAVQRAQAHAIATAHDVPLQEVATDELADARYAANAPDRCYFCKQELWTRLAAVAVERGLTAVADGTIADDAHDHRPGRRAGVQHGVVTPLADAGLGKDAVRAIAHALGLPNWDAPAAPCLSSRVLYGISVTPERLRQVEHAEALLRDVGVTGNFRVRHRGDEARLEVPPAHFDLLRARAEEIAERLHALGFRRVTLDLAGYRRGSLLHGESGDLEVLGAVGVS